MAAFCEKWGIDSMALFSSVLRPDFRPDSDIDFLVTFKEEERQGLLTVVRAKRELESLTSALPR
ncbi:MAG: nucleotidyltransferase domain-containing protein [Cyanobacteria bacterium P01_D01_bin.1]